MNLDTEKYLAPLRKENNFPVFDPRIVYAPTDVGAWRVVLIHQLTEDENQGAHNVYVDCLDKEGERVGVAKLLNLHYGWEGSEELLLAPFEKLAPEPVANFPIFKGTMNWVEIADSDFSDRVTNLTAQEGHSSWYIVWQWQEAATVKPPVDQGFVVIAKKKIRELLRKLAAGENLAAIVQVEEWLQ